MVYQTRKHSKLQIQLGRHLRRLRKERGHAISYVADQLGVGYSTISSIENGKSWPSARSVAALARTYELSVADVLAVPEETLPKRLTTNEPIEQIQFLLQNRSLHELNVAYNVLDALFDHFHAPRAPRPCPITDVKATMTVDREHLKQVGNEPGYYLLPAEHLQLTERGRWPDYITVINYREHNSTIYVFYHWSDWGDSGEYAPLDENCKDLTLYVACKPEQLQDPEEAFKLPKPKEY